MSQNVTSKANYKATIYPVDSTVSAEQPGLLIKPQFLSIANRLRLTTVLVGLSAGCVALHKLNLINSDHAAQPESLGASIASQK